jgi:hypothetical protein
MMRFSRMLVLVENIVEDHHAVDMMMLRLTRSRMTRIMSCC